MGYRNGILFRNLVLFAGPFWVYISSLLSPLYCVFNKFLFRQEEGENFDEFSETQVSRVTLSQIEEENSSLSSDYYSETGETEPPSIVECGKASVFDESNQASSPPKFLSFKFPSYEEFAKVNISSDVPTSLGNTLREEPEDLGFTPEDSCIDSVVDSFCPEDSSVDSKFNPSDDKLSSECEITSEKETRKQPDEVEFNHSEKLDWIEECHLPEEVKEEINKSNLVDQRYFSEKLQFLLEKDLLVSDSDSDSMSSSLDYSIMSRLLDSNSDDESIIVKDFRELEESERETESHSKEENETSESNQEEKLEGKGYTGESSEKPRMESPSRSDGEDSKCDLLWEHQELIEQLKMELKKVRATGLPTILEDAESPKIMDDLKPWKIDDKFQHQEKMGELHKIYRSYRERMRKLDILNYQKMYALGFLQSKDPLTSISNQKPTGPAITSLLSQSLKLCREKKSEDDSMVKFVRELHSDLEMVYVGQLCLSWEFLHWQYEKALELWESDQRNLRQYNEVAGEFQQLQVNMERFLENERFEGPRVQYYVKTRYFLRNLLQVPVIREDSLKDKMRPRLKGKGDYAISSDILVEILEESIRIFWQFIRADKDSDNPAQKDRKKGQPALQNPADLDLLAEIQAMLQKKEKKLKELLKGGNCILRKLQKHQEESSSDQVLCFFSQVDMKLVRRVLNMSRLTTDQLTWCSGKLNKIIFVRRRIHVEPSFLLFPC